MCEYYFSSFNHITENLKILTDILLFIYIHELYEQFNRVKLINRIIKHFTRNIKIYIAFKLLSF